MAKSGNGLAIFALLIGFIAIGWLGYNQFLGPSVSTTTTKSVSNLVNTQTVGGTYVDIPDLAINFTLTPGQRVLLTYSCVIQMVYPSQFSAFFVINGTRFTSYYASENSYQIDYRTVFMSYSPLTGMLPAGGHNVSIQVMGNTTINTYQHTLTVQTYAG